MSALTRLLSMLVPGERPDWEWFQNAADLVAGGRLDAAEDVIAEALAAGNLWRVSLLLAPTLDRLRGRDGFELLAAEARRRVEMRHIEPLVLTAMPAHPAGLAPLLLVLHGATGNASQELERWRPAAEFGWMVAAGQSSQPATVDGFCWDPPRERIWRDLEIIARKLPAHARLVAAGFSQGAWVALQLAMHADLLVSGTVIMVGPSANPEATLPPAWRRLKISMLVGEDDPYRDAAVRLAELLREHDHHVFVDRIPRLGHAYPSDFVDRLPRLLRP